MQNDLFLQRVFDALNLCEKNSVPKFLGFLSPEQAVLAGQHIKNYSIKHGFFGGFNSAERVMLGFFPEWAKDDIGYPICAITVNFRKQDRLSHRDFLGALMSLGLKRENIGDILTQEGRAVIFIKEESCDYVLSQLQKIGRTGVTLSKGFTLPLPEKGEMKEFSKTVSSNRLDCIVGAVANVSRTAAAELIEQGFVSVNSVVYDKVTKHISEGDIVSIRSKGKFAIDELNLKTAKGRLLLKYKKYT